MPREISRSCSHADQTVDDVGQLPAQLLLLCRHRRLDGTQFQTERNNALLRTVVEIAFEAAAGLVGGRDDAGT